MKFAATLGALFVLTTAGCGAPGALPLVAPAGTEATAASEKAKLGLGPVRFAATVNCHTELTPYAYVTLDAKPLVGRTVRSSEFAVTVAGKPLAGAHNVMVLGRDGKLYVSAHQRFNNGKAGDLYNLGTDFYAVGAYSSPKKLVNGVSFSFELAAGVRLERHTEWDIAFGNQDGIKIHFAGAPAVVRKPALVPAP